MRSWKLASFTVDITPPVGEPIAFGLNRRVDSPIHVRGVLLDAGRKRLVLAAADVLGLYGDVYRIWRRAIAAASGCPEKNVLLHCVHQHDSIVPPSREKWKRLAARPGDSQSSPAYYARILETLRAAVRKAARGSWAKVERLATAERRISGLASNRRLVGPDGKVFAMRWSMTTNRKLQREPVGRIDPLLRTIGFLGAKGRLLAALHFYATHPMGAYSREMAGADIPGVALAYAARACPAGVQQIYFTGCAGDITFGKYTFASKTENLRVLGARLGAALAANLAVLQPHPVGAVRLVHAAFDLPLDRKRINRSALLLRLRKARNLGEAYFPMHMLELLDDWKRWRRVELTRLDLGPDVHLLSLPAETVVAYQLFAQSMVPEKFLACAAYAEGLYGYLPTAEMFAEGGYEPLAGPATPELEAHYKAALGELLADLR